MLSKSQRVTCLNYISRRIIIRECEARLVMNSAITFCEYMISVHDK